jgi:hypothetical protein
MRCQHQSCSKFKNEQQRVKFGDVNFDIRHTIPQPLLDLSSLRGKNATKITLREYFIHGTFALVQIDLLFELFCACLPALLQ